MTTPDGIDPQDWATAIEAHERFPVLSLRADWDRDGDFAHELSDLTPLLEEVTVERSIAGELPPEVGLIEGYASAAMTAKVSGVWPGTIDQLAPDHDPRQNWCPRPACAVSDVGWNGFTGGSAATVGTPARVTGLTGMFRTTGFRHVATGGGDIAVGSALTPNVVRPGETWTGFVQWRADTDAPRVEVNLAWFTRGGNSFAGATTTVYSGGGGAGEVRTAVISGPAPDGAWATNINVVLKDMPSGGPYTLMVTAVRLDRGEQPNMAYGDGDDVDWVWDGYPGESTSTLPPHVLTSTQDAVGVFAPYRDDSPLHARPLLRTPVTLDTGFLTETGAGFDRRFTGSLASITVDSANRTVDLSFLDAAGQLRAPISLPAVAIDAVLFARYGQTAYNTRFNTQWLIDHILRRNGIYASPPARSDAVLSVTGHGSHIPEVGLGGTPIQVVSSNQATTPNWVVDGPFNMLTSLSTQSGRWWPSQPVTVGADNGVGFSMWMVFAPPSVPGFNTEATLFTLQMAESVWLRFSANGDGRPKISLGVIDTEFYSLPPIAASTTFEWKFVGVHVRFSDVVMHTTWRINGQTFTDETSCAPRQQAWLLDPYVDYTTRRSITNFQVWQQTPPPADDGWIGETWTSQADLDPGANVLFGIPALTNEDSLGLLKEVVAAELGVFGFNENGRFFFQSRVRDAGDRGEITETLTTDQDIVNVGTVTDEASIRNTVTVTAVAPIMENYTTIVASQDPEQFDTQVGTTVYVLDLPPNTCQLGATDSYIWEYDQTAWQSRDQRRPNRTQIDCMIIRADDPTVVFGQTSRPPVDIALRRVDATTALLVVTNRTGYPIRFATPYDDSTGNLTPGEPALEIPGRLVVDQDQQSAAYSEDGSILAYGESAYDLGGNNRWRQDVYGMAAVAQSVLAQTAHPVPVLDTIEAPHDPRRRLEQQVLVSDARGLGSIRCRIAGITTKVDAGKVVDVITARPISPAGLGLIEDPEFGLLDETLVLGP